jgi:hypothetical protein
LVLSDCVSQRFGGGLQLFEASIDLLPSTSSAWIGAAYGVRQPRLLLW